ncbi:MAG: hypothetical protein EBV30_11430, partial [Actinobacteria bacterium]|nr:hypothetical protein [Actinomycetota bacterium]
MQRSQSSAPRPTSATQQSAAHPPKPTPAEIAVQRPAPGLNSAKDANPNRMNPAVVNKPVEAKQVNTEPRVQQTIKHDAFDAKFAAAAASANVPGHVDPQTGQFIPDAPGMQPGMQPG